MNEPIRNGSAGPNGGGRHPDPDQVAAFLENALPAHERDAMLAHLAVCPDCRTTVVLALPPQELPAAPAGKSRSWWAGWGLAWPAGAALALTAVLALYLRHQALRHGPPATVELARVPHLPEIAPGPVPYGVAGSAAKVRDKKENTGPPETPARRRNQAATEEPKLAGVREAPVTQNRPLEPPAPSPKQKQAGALAFGGAYAPRMQPAEGDNALKKAEVRAAPDLPSRLPVLSMAARGSQILAIDSASAVFLSEDQGEHWTPVPVHWRGHAVKADLVAFGGAPFAQGRRTAAFAPAGASASSLQLAAPMSRAEEGATASQPASSPRAAPDDEKGNGGDQLTGIVTDRSGAAIPGATVTLRGAKDQTKRTAVTGPDGGYLLRDLAPGTYQLEAEARGFERGRASPIEVQDARLNVENVTLNIGAATQSVTVDASQTPALDTQSLTLPVEVSAKAQAPPAPVFQITTDSGEQWTSADGRTWKRK